MSRTQFLTIVLLSTTFAVNAGLAVGQSPRVVVVSIQEIGQKSKKFAAIQKRLESEVNKKGAEIEALKSQFTQMVEKLQQGAKDMKAAAQQELQEKLAGLKGQIEVKQQGIQAYVEREMRSAEESLIKEIQGICKKMNFDIVIPGALYVKPEFDATAQVLAEMDKNVASESTATLKKLENDVEAMASKVKKAL